MKIKEIKIHNYKSFKNFKTSIKYIDYLSI
jgi:DNA repair exonuclease SbcCD ATPase subunit